MANENESTPSEQSNPSDVANVQYKLTNSSGHMAHVPVEHVVTKAKNSVFVQPGGQPKLDPGYVIDPVFASRNPKIVAVAVA